MRTILLVGFLLLAGTAMAQSPAVDQPQSNQSTSKTEWTGAWTTSVFSQYFGPNYAVIATEPVAQSELDINWKRGKVSGSFMVWASKGLPTRGDRLSNEADFGLALAYAGKVNVSASYWHYTLVESAGSDIETAQFKVEKALTIHKRHTLTPSGRLELYWPSSSKGPRAGQLLVASLTHALEVAGKITMTQQLQFGRDLKGVYGYKPRTNILRYDAGLDINMGHNWSIGPRLTYGGAFGDPDRPFKVTVGFAVTKTFTIRKARVVNRLQEKKQ